MVNALLVLITLPAQSEHSIEQSEHPFEFNMEAKAVRASWPWLQSDTNCTGATKQKALYISYAVEPPLDTAPATKFEVGSLH